MKKKTKTESSWKQTEMGKSIGTSRRGRGTKKGKTKAELGRQWGRRESRRTSSLDCDTYMPTSQMMSELSGDRRSSRSTSNE